MASTLKNLVETKVERSLGGNAVDLILRWREAGVRWRSIQAETYRIAAMVAEASQDERWCVEARTDCGIISRGLLGTYIRLELADATDAESARAVAILLGIAHDIRR